MQNTLLTSFIEAFMEEVTPVVPDIPGISVTDYKRTLIERFSNPTINDQITRIASQGSAKVPKWLLPSIVELRAAGRPVGLASLAVASWIFYLGRGVAENGQPLEILDARATELTGVAAGGGLHPAAMFAVRSIFGEKLPADATFVSEVEHALRQLAEKGGRATIQAALDRARRAA